MKGLEMWDKVIDEHPVLSIEEEGELVAIRLRGGEGADEAVEKLVLHNLRAVVNHVDRMNAKDLDKADLFAAGITGLRRAAQRFRPMTNEKGTTRLIHSAYLWIREAVNNQAKFLWHDHVHMDAQTGDEIKITAMGATEDNLEWLDSTMFSELSEMEQIIFQARITDITHETNKELAVRASKEWKIKTQDLNHVLTRVIIKLLKKGGEHQEPELSQAKKKRKKAFKRKSCRHPVLLSEGV